MAQTKRTLLRNIVTTRQAKQKWRTWVFFSRTLAGTSRGCEDLAGKPLDEDLWEAELEMPSQEVSYTEVRDDVVAYAERRRESSTTRPVTMDIGSQNNNNNMNNKNKKRRHRRRHLLLAGVPTEGEGMWEDVLPHAEC